MKRRVREIATPEGVSLPFEVASASDRLAAFALDFLIVHAVVVAVVGLGFVLAAGGFGQYAHSVALLVSFLTRNFYFTFFELRWGGLTVGKKRLGLRVISRDGGPLRAEAVFTRNLTRDLEVFLPLTALMSPTSLLPSLPAWAALVGSVWLVVFGLLPLFGRDRLRIGDLLAGTLVVNMSRVRLEEDLSTSPVLPRQEVRSSAPEITFDPVQLDMYGIKELQLLETILRDSYDEDEVLEAVAAKIKNKIGYPAENTVNTRRFLEAFYAAQRGRLEHRMLFGDRREEKKEGTLTAPPGSASVHPDASEE